MTRVELGGQRRHAEARIDARGLIALIVDDRHAVALRRIAAPRRLSRIVDRARSLAGNGKEVPAETRRRPRLEHPVGEHVLLRNLPIGIDLALQRVAIREVGRRRAGRRARIPADDFQIEAVHLAAVDFTHRLRVVVRGRIAIFEQPGGHRHRLAQMVVRRRLAGIRIAHRIRAGERLARRVHVAEDVIERTILLNDDNNVRVRTG